MVLLDKFIVPKGYREMFNYIQNTLQEIGKKFKTDKASHRFKGITYLHIYDIYLRHLIGKNPNVFEMGVLNGSSFATWKEYFKNAHLCGLDISPSCAKLPFKIYIGEQSNEKLLNKIVSENGLFDVIIDDCSHINELTIKSFNFLWKYVKPNGIYIIEDLANSYTKDLGKDIKNGRWPNMDLLDKKIVMKNDRAIMNKIFLSIIEQIDKRSGTFHFIHFWPMTCVIGKVKG